jgi:metallo-beta-lactamase family protein
VLGSAAVHIAARGKRQNNLHHLSAVTWAATATCCSISPQTFPQADYILLESTYGDSLHKDIGPIEDALLEIIKQTCEVKKGKVIIPAFSVGPHAGIAICLKCFGIEGRVARCALLCR